MRIIGGGRRSGKTMKLLKFAEKENAVIICNHIQMAKDLKKRAKDLGFKIKDPVHIGSNTFRGRGKEKYLIDNAEEIIYRYLREQGLNGEVLASTININEYLEEREDD